MDIGIGEIIKDLYGEYKTRIKYRIISSYVYSYIVWNIDKLLIFAFASSEINSRVETFSNSMHEANYRGYWFPLVMAVIWIYAIPVINVIIEIGSKWTVWRAEDFLQKMRDDRKETLIDERIRFYRGKLEDAEDVLRETNRREDILFIRVRHYMDNRFKIDSVVERAFSAVEEAPIGFPLRHENADIVAAAILNTSLQFTTLSVEFVEQNIRACIDGLSKFYYDFYESNRNMIASKDIEALETSRIDLREKITELRHLCLKQRFINAEQLKLNTPNYSLE